MKNFVLAVCAIVVCACTSNSNERDSAKDVADLISYTGETQGTYYRVTYVPEGENDNRVRQEQIDSILHQFDLSLSLWIDSSTISKFNSTNELLIKDPHFMTMVFRSREISSLTKGAFHPMVMPLVKAWGFGPDGGQIKENANLDSLKKLVTWRFDIELLADNDSYDKEYPEQKFAIKKDSGLQIDFNAIAQGYSVDVISDFLEGQSIQNYMVEVGGEVRAKGKNGNDIYWRIGIDKPVENAENRELQAIVNLKDAALATSGNYRKFYEKEGIKYSHTIDPKTGRPVSHSLLSATVMAANCANADAFATAFMVMGFEKSKNFIEEHPELNLEVYFIYGGEGGGYKTYISPGMAESVDEI